MSLLAFGQIVEQKLKLETSLEHEESITYVSTIKPRQQARL
jgi:hypothetical protein